MWASCRACVCSWEFEVPQKDKHLHNLSLSPPDSSWDQTNPSQIHLDGFYSFICGFVLYLVSPNHCCSCNKVDATDPHTNIETNFISSLSATEALVSKYLLGLSRHLHLSNKSLCLESTPICSNSMYSRYSHVLWLPQNANSGIWRDLIWVTVTLPPILC